MSTVAESRGENLDPRLVFWTSAVVLVTVLSFVILNGVNHDADGDVVMTEDVVKDYKGRPIPKWAVEEGASGDPRVCTHRGMILGGECQWCGAQLNGVGSG